MSANNSKKKVIANLTSKQSHRNNSNTFEFRSPPTQNKVFLTSLHELVYIATVSYSILAVKNNEKYLLKYNMSASFFNRSCKYDSAEFDTLITFFLIII